MEVKNVPLADYEDMFAIERKKANFENIDFNSKVAYFPDGYRKKAIQRNDVNRFSPSIIDPEYRSAVLNAIKIGVEIITMVVEWNESGEAKFIRDDLPIV